MPDPASPTTSPPRSERLRALWPEIRQLVVPRRALLALGLLLILVNRVSGLVLPASTKYLIDDVIGKRQASLLLPIIAAVVGATLLQGVTSFALTQLLSKEAQRLIAEMRRRVQAHVGRLPVAFYDATKTGNLVSRIMSDVEGVRNLIGTGLVELVGGLMTAVFALVVLVRLSPIMTVVAFAVLVTFVVVLNKAFAVIRPIFRERGKINAEVTGRLTESLAAVRVVKGYHAESREAQVFSGGVERLLQNVLKTLTATSTMGLASTLLMGFVGAIVMFVGARQVLGGAMTLGDFFTYTLFLGFLVAPVFQIVQIGTQLTEALAGLERTREILAQFPEDQDPDRTRSIGTIRGQVRFEDVSFAYEPSRVVLEEITFTAEPGTVTALVGPSGAGKSTLIGLIAAFHRPTHGRVVVDGIDLGTIRLESYRVQLGVVLQETFLFDGTIRENVSFSRPDASTDEILAACKIARVDEFAEAFPDGYDTVVGERGVKLSGGQRQRVSIARAILADPRILILDEATSSLDSESEALIQEGLSALMRGRTTFVIAHRLSTIRRADQILVMEAGRIIERGSHETLYAAGGRYYDLYTRQHGLEANLFLAPGEAESAARAAEEAAQAEAVRSGAGGAPSDALGLLRPQ
jgi:ABC-type multidrug transport system fused ATPase/permease subunit